MGERISFVKLNCLNCGASLEITPNLFEFACQYCGATQIVERSGGTIALKMLTDRIERIENSIEKTAAEIKIQKSFKDLENLEIRKKEFLERSEQQENIRNPILAIGMGGGILLSGFLAFQLNSVFPVITVLVIEIVIFMYLKKTLRKEDAGFQKTLNSHDEKIAQLKSKIAELKRITEN